MPCRRCLLFVAEEMDDLYPPASRKSTRTSHVLSRYSSQRGLLALPARFRFSLSIAACRFNLLQPPHPLRFRQSQQPSTSSQYQCGGDGRGFLTAFPIDPTAKNYLSDFPYFKSYSSASIRLVSQSSKSRLASRSRSYPSEVIAAIILVLAISRISACFPASSLRFP